MKSTNEMVYPSGTPAPPVDETELATVSGYVILLIAAVLVAGGVALIVVNRGPSTAIGAVLFFSPRSDWRGLPPSPPVRCEWCRSSGTTRAR
jgi:hypothetical protein